jgi:hypothetical protein
VRKWLRWVFNSLVILSALSCVGTTGIWIWQLSWGYHRTMGVWGNEPRPLVRWLLDENGVWGVYNFSTATVISKLKSYTEFTVLGFLYHCNLGDFSLNDREFHFYIGYRFLLAVGSTLPVCWLCAVMWRKKRRLISGVCVVCGYDLRATPVRCPECGTVAAKKLA